MWRKVASLYASVVVQWQPYSVDFVVEMETLTDQIHILNISALVLHFFQDYIKIQIIVMYYLKDNNIKLPY